MFSHILIGNAFGSRVKFKYEVIYQCYTVWIFDNSNRIYQKSKTGIAIFCKMYISI